MSRLSQVISILGNSVKKKEKKKKKLRPIKRIGSGYIRVTIPTKPPPPSPHLHPCPEPLPHVKNGNGRHNMRKFNNIANAVRNNLISDEIISVQPLKLLAVAPPFEHCNMTTTSYTSEQECNTLSFALGCFLM